MWDTLNNMRIKLRYKALTYMCALREWSAILAVSARSYVECLWDQAILGDIDDTGLIRGFAMSGLWYPGKLE